MSKEENNSPPRVKMKEEPVEFDMEKAKEEFDRIKFSVKVNIRTAICPKCKKDITESRKFFDKPGFYCFDCDIFVDTESKENKDIRTNLSEYYPASDPNKPTEADKYMEKSAEALKQFLTTATIHSTATISSLKAAIVAYEGTIELIEEELRRRAIIEENIYLALLYEKYSIKLMEMVSKVQSCEYLGEYPEDWDLTQEEFDFINNYALEEMKNPRDYLDRYKSDMHLLVVLYKTNLLKIISS